MKGISAKAIPQELRVTVDLAAVADSTAMRHRHAARVEEQNEGAHPEAELKGTGAVYAAIMTAVGVNPLGAVHEPSRLMRLSISTVHPTAKTMRADLGQSGVEALSSGTSEVGLPMLVFVHCEDPGMVLISAQYFCATSAEIRDRRRSGMARLKPNSPQRVERPMMLSCRSSSLVPSSADSKERKMPGPSADLISSVEASGFCAKGQHWRDPPFCGSHRKPSSVSEIRLLAHKGGWGHWD
jgi:hypothetical protein